MSSLLFGTWVAIPRCLVWPGGPWIDINEQEWEVPKESWSVMSSKRDGIWICSGEEENKGELCHRLCQKEGVSRTKAGTAQPCQGAE